MQYAAFSSVNELQQLLPLAGNAPFILGGGSNILLPLRLERPVLHNKITGIAVHKNKDRSIEITAGGGVIWHDLVTMVVNQGWRGLENLALIPGTVGAAPIQNIGAYGVELRDVFFSLEAVSIDNGSVRRFSLEDCAFGYRDSFFKRDGKDKWVITSVTLRLPQDKPLQYGYGDIARILEANGMDDPTSLDIYKAVITIRQNKLPDPTKIGNAGSFFKNPVVTNVHLESILKDWPDMPYYPNDNANAKIPAGWLIEKAGWKGYNQGTCGVHEAQALVLVNRGGAIREDVVALADKIVESVFLKFKVHLEPEVNFVEP